MRNYDIYEKLKLDYTPVAVKFSMTKPENLPLLTEKMAMCEMLDRCQKSGGIRLSPTMAHRPMRAQSPCFCR